MASQGNSINSRVPDGYCTGKDAALRVGRSYDTLRQWEKDGVFTPSTVMKMGELTVRLYSDEDIETLKQIARTKGKRKQAS